MKRERAFHQSLRFRVTVGVLLPLLIILSILARVRHNSYQDLLFENLHNSAANTGEVIEGSLQHAMLTHDFSALEQIVGNIGEQPGVGDLFLLDKAGNVLLSTDDEVTGQTIDLDDVTCQACHVHKAAKRNENVVLTLAGGKRVLRNVIAIDNAQECQSCHSPEEPMLGVLISDFDMGPVERALANDRRTGMLWSAGSILLVTLVVDLVVSRMVIRRLEQLAQAIEQVSEGNLSVRVAGASPDEVGGLGHAFNHMADGLAEKARLEQSLRVRTEQLQVQAEKLSTLNTVAATVSQSLDLSEVLNSALDKVLDLMRLRAGWVVLQSDQADKPGLAASRGLPKEVALAHVHCVWNRCICADVINMGQPKVFDAGSEHACPTVDHFAEEGLVLRACVPLKSKDLVLGVMSLIGDASSGVQELSAGTLETLTAIGRQIGVAVENARLWEELQHKEAMRGQLLHKIITAQEEERRRISRGLHDEASQALTSILVGLRTIGKATGLTQIRALSAELRNVVTQTLDGIHDLSLKLRPRVLDDLGLVPALARYVASCPTRFGFQADFVTTGMDDQRLPPEVEITLYRIAQEALTNVARHANASHASVLLQRRKGTVVLVVDDDGVGFDVAEVMASPEERERLGLYGMEERALLVGGRLSVESRPGDSTTILAEIPLEATWLTKKET
jgi:signal transduction histidine kinase